jgi:alginate O-acetyltransferase complex protein AlgJ
MTKTAAHWWGLIAGVGALQIGMLVLDRLPMVREPELVENRSLATPPAAPRSIRDLDRFRTQADAYAADHLPARRFLIAGLNFFRYSFGYSGTRRVFVGREGWLFYDNDSHLSQVRDSTMSIAERGAWVDELAKRTRGLAAKGIRYVVVAGPVKESLYPDLLPRWLRSQGSMSDASVLLKASNDAGIHSVVDFKAPLASARDRGIPIYSRFDTHWTGDGAFYGYQALMGRFASMGLQVRAHPRSYFVEPEIKRAARPQDLAHMLGISSFVEQTYSSLEDPKKLPAQRVEYLTESKDWTADRVVETGRTGPVLLLTGDSFSTALLPLLSGHFSRVIFSHHEHGFFREDLIDRFKPDVVVLEVIESGFRYAMQQPVAKK